MKRALISAVMVAGIALLLFGCERSTKKASSKLPPTPETDPLAQPKSLQQVGAPVAMTREKIPADNPQIPEKISLGQRLFFDRRLSVDGTCRAAHAMIRRGLSPMGSLPQSASKAGSANATPRPS